MILNDFQTVTFHFNAQRSRLASARRVDQHGAMTRFSFLLLTWVLSAGAFEIPTGIIALPAPDDEQAPCGGAAVVLGCDEDGSLRAVTLAEALPVGDIIRVTLPGGARRQAVVVVRGTSTTAVLLRIAAGPSGTALKPVACADSNGVTVGTTVWTAGNASASLEYDGVVAVSRGIVSGRYDIPFDMPPVRGRAGRVLSQYRGPVLEIDAAVNDGNQGGALLDNAGRLVGLVSLGCARERRLGTAIPLRAILADLGLAPVLERPASGDPEHVALALAAARIAPALALIYLQRPDGLGNSEAVPRPNVAVDEAPLSDREQVQRWWNVYYHQQQMFWTDQPVTAVCVDAQQGLLITAASNLHGGAQQGQILLPTGPVACSVVAEHLPLDLALLKAERALSLAEVTFAGQQELPIGRSVGIIGRHQVEAGWTFTMGVVSATTRRRLRSDYAFRQTDAEGNYGNLGGPVITAQGAVVGLSVLLGPDTEERPWLINSGVTLFVDGGAVTAALPDLIAGKSTQRGTFVGLGVRVNYVPGQRPHVKTVTPGSGAALAGLKPGDVLDSVDGLRIADHTTIVRTLMRRKAGEKIPVVLRRNGTPMTLLIELKEIPE